MQISPGIHAVDLFGAQAHLILHDGLTLIDAGLPGSRFRLQRYLARYEWSLDDLVRIVCTHGHPDHAGGVRELARDGAEVLMHPADFAGLRVPLREVLRRPSRGRLFAWVTPTPLRASPIVDGQMLPMLGGTQVIHTPGHTPGSICLYVQAQRMLFVGDALEMRRGRVSFASARYSDDPRRARTSVQRMAELDVETIVFSHYPPWRDDARGTLQALAKQSTAD